MRWILSAGAVALLVLLGDGAERRAAQPLPQLVQIGAAHEDHEDDIIKPLWLAGGTAAGVATDVAGTPTPPGTPVPPPAAPVVTHTLPPGAPVQEGIDMAERMELAELVRAAFPGDPYMYEHVVWAESLGDWAGDRWRCYVYGPCWSPTGDCGLLQTNRVHAPKYEALGYPMDVGCWIPAVNILVAQMIYAAQGPGAWTTYR